MSNFDCAAFAKVAKTCKTFQELEQSVSAIVNNDLHFRIIAAKCTSSFHFAFTMYCCYKNYYGACSQWNSQGKCIICLDSAAFSGYYSIVVVFDKAIERERVVHRNFSFSRNCRTYFLPHDLITLERPITIITQNVDGLSDVRHLTLLRSRKYTDVLPLKRALCKCIQITYCTDSPSTEGFISQT